MEYGQQRPGRSGQHAPATLHDADLTRWHPTNRNRLPRAGEVWGHRSGRHDRHADAVEGERRDESDTVDLGQRHERDADRVGREIEFGPVGSPSRCEYHWNLVELGGIELRPVPPEIALRDDGEDLLVEQRRHRHVGVVERQVHDGQRQRAGQKLGGERRRRGVDHDDMHTGVTQAHALVQCRNDPAGHRADHADTNLADHFGAQRIHIGDQRLELTVDPAGPADDDLTFLGETTG